ncbi:MAG: hypothetical protein KAT28_01680 [Candidatus Aenigmarchaeota archaeon]|nr:hypothetical protein [Candidatus Aenigmarchaeota archaeon]
MDTHFTEKDFKNAERVIKQELIKPLTTNNLFRKGLYWILSGTENHKKQTILYNNLTLNFNTPKSILANKPEVHEIIKESRFPNRKEKFIAGFSEFYLESDLPEKILEDSYNGRQNGFELREELVKDAPGLGHKCGSGLLQSCGYNYLVMVDIWALRFLENYGYKVKIPDYKTVGGITKKEYFEYENIISGMAKEYEVSPVVFQAAIWLNGSGGGVYDQTTFNDF